MHFTSLTSGNTTSRKDIPAVSAPKAGLPALFHRVSSFAHRGITNTHTPGNTISALDKAAQSGFGLAIDVRMTKDRHLVAFQAASLSGRESTSAISETRQSDLPKIIRNGSKHEIPLLTEILERYSGLPIYLDLKAPGLEKNLATLLSRYPYANEHIVVNTWWTEGLRILNQSAPQVTTSRGFGRAVNSSWLREVLNAEPKMVPILNFWKQLFACVSIDVSYYTPEMVELFREQGFEIFLIGPKRADDLAFTKEAISICQVDPADSGRLM
jgi:hypothetical protein